MKLVQVAPTGIELKLSRRNVEDLLSVLDEGDLGKRLTKITLFEGEQYHIVIGVENDERHYNWEGIAE